MKKVISTFALGAILATVASADFARVEAGAGAWMQTPSGVSSYKGGGVAGSDTLNEDMDTSGYVWALVKHPIPIVPNLRLEYTTMHATGNATGTWGATTAITGTSDSTLDITEVDIIPYYNLLDNTFWITVDVGIDLKIIQSDYKIAPSGLFTGYDDSTTTPLPLGYVRGRVQLPTTNLGVEADVKYITTGSSLVYDVRAKVDYTFDIFPIIQPGIEVGYRVQKIKIDESGIDVKTDVDFSGVYAGIMLRF
ncbi:TIGR04219 family outer membrane beta-barrel protein [Sulfurimonas sp.]